MRVSGVAIVFRRVEERNLDRSHFKRLLQRLPCSDEFVAIDAAGMQSVSILQNGFKLPRLHQHFGFLGMQRRGPVRVMRVRDVATTDLIAG